MIKKKGILHQGMIILLCMSLVVCGAMTATVLVSQRLAMDSASRVMLKAHDYMIQQMDTYMSSMEQVAYSVGYSPSVQKSLLLEDAPLRILSSADELRSVFSAAFVYSPYISGISLYDAELNYVISSGNVYFDVSALDSRYASITQGVYTGERAAEDGYITQVVYVYPLFRADTVIRRDMYRLGYLMFTLDAEFLNAMIAQGDFYEDTIIAITDEDGNALLANQPMTEAEATALLQDAGEQSMHKQTAISRTSWTLHSVMPASLLSTEMLPLLYLVWATAGLLLIMVLWMYAFFRHSILKPLSDLRRFMTELPDAHKRISLKRRPENELLETMRILNEMLDSLEAQGEALIRSQTRVLQEETARQQMEIIAYRNQVNPHFLYNTLDCIRGIAYMHDVPEIVEISEALSAMFRYAVKGDDFVTLEKEITYIRSYATIIAHRFSQRIRIRMDIDEALLSCRVIKLLLQPLVENAVLHGLEKKLGDGDILITARRQDRRLCFQVADNGCGITEKRLAELNAKLDSVRSADLEDPSTQGGIGLMNIARRLFLHYGTAYSLRIYAGAQGGAVVEILLPEQGEEESHV